jgi:Icc-related predicted phosphoesterase
MTFGAVGDLHGHFDVLDRIMSHHPEISFWLCPGDLANEAGEYPAPQAPLYWIKGNNEDFDFVASQPPASGTIPNLHYLPNGVTVAASGLTLAGLGGTLAPTWYETPAAMLPSWREAKGHGMARSAGKDDKRRHFVHEEVEACSALRGIDVFLSHEAPRPFVLEQRRGSGPARRIDAGKTPINDVLAAMQPRLHLFGHHHRYTVAERQKVTSIGLEMVTESYLIIDGKSLAHQRLKTYSP